MRFVHFNKHKQERTRTSSLTTSFLFLTASRWALASGHMSSRSNCGHMVLVERRGAGLNCSKEGVIVVFALSTTGRMDIQVDMMQSCCLMVEEKEQAIKRSWEHRRVEELIHESTPQACWTMVWVQPPRCWLMVSVPEVQKDGQSKTRSIHHCFLFLTCL